MSGCLSLTGKPVGNDQKGWLSRVFEAVRDSRNFHGFGVAGALMAVSNMANPSPDFMPQVFALSFLYACSHPIVKWWDGVAFNRVQLNCNDFVITRDPTAQEQSDTAMQEKATQVMETYLAGLILTAISSGLMSFVSSPLDDRFSGMGIFAFSGLISSCI